MTVLVANLDKHLFVGNGNHERTPIEVAKSAEKLDIIIPAEDLLGCENIF